MARKIGRGDRRSTDKTSEIRIKEGAAEDELFKRQEDPYVLPPELNITIKDGFRFGLGFLLAMIVFYVIVLIGVVAFVKFGTVINLG